MNIPQKTAVGIAHGGLMIGLCALAGCAYMETVMNRVAGPEDRIQLGLRDRTVSLDRREITDYTCVDGLLLQCKRGAGSKFFCRCVPR